jgi:eukaryotic-like serine/threonine-protein kinase
MAPSADRWHRIEALFQELLAVPPQDRAAALLRACPDDAALRDEVSALLNAADGSSVFIHDAIGSEAAHVLRADARVGEVVGAYRLTGEIGRGGMGMVYRAERADDQYRATVAVKFLRGGRADPESARRFRAERQILADLVHPNIARLLDGGTASDGTPYLVMELVDGEPLDVWCTRAALDVRARVQLFRQVCAAVQHAHQALVIHRDLKPSNILVTGTGVPKLLDFGIAKLLDPDADGDQTTALHAMTSSYASPEQLRGERVTTASDVYSLGVVLYRLLAGRPPFDLEGLSPGEVERRVCDTEPPRPSERADAAVARELRGDLDNILLKALRKEPERRYGSAAELSEDLRRYLAREPVGARPDVVTYRVSRFVRRHAVGVGATALAMLLLATLATTSVVQARRATVERDRAEERQLTAERVTEFLVGMFEDADPNVASGDTVTAREMLDRGATRILAELDDAPAVRAELATTIGRVYLNLSALSEARTMFDSAVAIRRAVNGPNSVEYANALHDHADLLYSEGDYEAAELVHREALAIRRAVLPPGHGEISESLDGLAATLDELSRFEESVLLYRESLAITRDVYGPDDPLTASALMNLAAPLRHQAKYEEAAALLRDAVATARRARGDRHLDVALALNHLARTLTQMGSHEEALPVAQEAADIQANIHGAPHPETAATLGNISGILASLGRLEESETARRASLDILRAVLGDEHPYVAATVNSLASIQHQRGDLAAAEASYRESLRLHRIAFGPAAPNTGYPLTGLGRLLNDAGRHGEAEPLLREAYDLRRNGLPEGHWHIAASALPLGEALTVLGRFEEAETLLKGAVETLDGTFGAEDERAARARERLADLYERTGRADLASSLRGS